LRTQGKLPEAVAAFQEAIRQSPGLPQARYGLGFTLEEQGKFREALDCLHKGQDLADRLSGQPSAYVAVSIRRVERLVELDRNLSAFLTAQRKPSGPDELLELAHLCGHPAKRLYAAAARFCQDAFAARPALLGDLRVGHRYQAARYAALAGCGRAEDAADLTEKERGRLRNQARQWLSGDLALHADRLNTGHVADRAKVLETMDHWRADAALAGVRGTESIQRLPAEERQGWAKLWHDVEALHKKAREMSRK
jgi:serine/threonine-protein kinase